MTAKLVQALPELVNDVHAALVQLGRGDLADQLREVELGSWTYDDFADAAYLHVQLPNAAGSGDGAAMETVSALDDVNLSVDGQRRITGIEVLGAKWIVSRLQGPAPSIRKSTPDDFAAMLAIVNDAARAYRGVIPADRWHEPYMSGDDLAREIRDGIEFWVAEQDGRIAGVMGIQDKGEVALVRHAYVASTTQRGGIGSRLLRHVEGLVDKPVLIGTWAAASWAIAFYGRNGYIVVPPDDKTRLLRKYWSIPERQVETSVVLAKRQTAVTSSATP